jgi:hypothetical protein
MKETLRRIVIQSIRVTRDALAVILVFFPFPKYKHLQMPMSFLQRLVRDYTGIHSSVSLPKLSDSLLSVDNILRRFGLGLIDFSFINFVASSVQLLLVVLLLPLGPLGSFSLGAEVVAEPLLDACELSEIRPQSCVSRKQRHTHNTVGTQVMCALDSSTAGALVERCDILETLASHLSVTLLHV